jgi:hypothetical protein
MWGYDVSSFDVMVPRGTVMKPRCILRGYKPIIQVYDLGDAWLLAVVGHAKAAAHAEDAMEKLTSQLGTLWQKIRQQNY